MKSRLAEGSPAALSRVAEATAELAADQPDALVRARAFAVPLIAGEALDTGENTLAHADAVVAILRTIGGSESMQAASYLVYACDHLNRPQEVIAKSFGANLAALAMETTQLVRVQRQARASQQAASTAALAAPMAQTAAMQTENIRKMLLAFSRDLRVVMLRLASRLQTLRHYAATKLPVPPGLARESLQVFAPLANRLGIWEIKWELEDLAFRFPRSPTPIARSRACSSTSAANAKAASSSCAPALEADLRREGIAATVQGRPKHIYSIVKKMRGKSLGFGQVYDIRALRIIVESVADCYQALSIVRHSHFAAVPEEFDDYVAKPEAQWLPVAAHHRARRRSSRRSRCRSAPSPCTTMPNTAWRRTGPTRRPGPRGMPASRPAASTTPRSRCCASCWPGSVTSPAPRARACSTTASTC